MAVVRKEEVVRRTFRLDLSEEEVRILYLVLGKVIDSSRNMVTAKIYQSIGEHFPDDLPSHHEKAANVTVRVTSAGTKVDDRVGGAEYSER